MQNMSIFSARDALAMAVKLEEDGMTFYREVARQVTDTAVARTLEELALQEHSHRDRFTAMARRLEADPGAPQRLARDMEGYLDAFINGKVFSGAAFHRLLKAATSREAVVTAIHLEHASIAFYHGIMPLVPPHLGPDWLEDIIFEEYRHVDTLVRLLDRL